MTTTWAKPESKWVGAPSMFVSTNHRKGVRNLLKNVGIVGSVVF
jgi:hypothetical protein